MNMTLSSSDIASAPIAEKALRRWAAERLQRQVRDDGGVIYTFLMSGSTCSNMGIPLDVIMTVIADVAGRIQSTSARPAPHDTGCDAMCAAGCDGRRFLAQVGQCDEVIGLTLREAALRNWDPEPSGCLCTAGNRRHKWRNVFQTLHYATTHG